MKPQTAREIVLTTLLGAIVGALLGYALATWGLGVVAGGSAIGTEIGMTADAAQRATANISQLQHGFRHVNTILNLGNWSKSSGEAFRQINQNMLQYPTTMVQNWVYLFTDGRSHLTGVV